MVWLGRNLKDHLVQTPGLGQGHFLAQVSLNVNFEMLRAIFTGTKLSIAGKQIIFIKEWLVPRFKITYFKLQVVHWGWCDNTVEWSKPVLISHLFTIQLKLRLSYFAIHVKCDHCLKRTRQSTVKSVSFMLYSTVSKVEIMI